MKKCLTPILSFVTLVSALGGQDRNGVGSSHSHVDPRLGIDLAGFDRAVRPQDDFFLYVNGAWLKNTPIPEDKSNYGVASKVADKAEADVRSIIEEAAGRVNPAGSVAQKVGDLYSSYINEPLAEKLGIGPISGELSTIDLIDSKAALLKHFAHLLQVGVDIPIGGYINQDARKSTEYAVYLNQSGLGLPDKEFYFKAEPKFQEIRRQYSAYIEKLFSLAGLDSPPQAAQRILELETAIAQHHWTRVENRDRQKTYNKKTMEALAQEAPGFDWKKFMEASGVRVPEVIVRQPSYFTALGKLLDEKPLSDWKDYLKWKILDENASLLNPVFVDAHFEFREKALSGVHHIRPRWKRGVGVVNAALGEAVGRIYVQRHFKPEAKAQMQKLVNNLTEAFRTGIQELDWMTPETKTQALKKLARFNTKIGNPDQWKDYSKLVIKKDELVQNLWRSARFEHDRSVSKLGKPIDRTEWLMTPQTVNAYYNPTMNEIVFPAAILQPPFFNLAADDAVNYGAIGAVIGHEIGHGFDDQGRRSDGDGNLSDWWTEADAREFSARSKKLVEQYSAYNPIDNLQVNGAFTLGENIGDLGGLTIAYRAYQLSLKGKPAPVIEGFTGPQRFFLGWAQAWRRKYRDEELRQRLVTDPHSPSQYRCIGVVSNMPEFYEAFGVKESDKMYRLPEGRVKIW